MSTTATGYCADSFSREDYQSYLNNRYVTTDGQSLEATQHSQYQTDGGGNEKKKKTVKPSPSTRGELVGGISQIGAPARPHRREEMVTPNASSSRISYYGEMTNWKSSQSTHQRETSHNTSGHHQHDRSSRSRERESSSHRRERKRSVSPQMKSSTAVAISSKSANETKNVVVHKQKGAKKHNKEEHRQDLSCYETRVNTFHLLPSWPSEKSMIEPLASHGTFYIGQEDITQCHSCLVRIEGWKSTDDVLLRHFKASPNCSFLRENYHHDIERLCAEDAKFTSYRDSKEREVSFQYWPIPLITNVLVLVMAGWFYTGKDDITQCFTCGCRYEDWKKGDDPVAIHKKLSSKCSFLKEIDGAAASAKMIDFSSKKLRLESFKNYPSASPVSIESLVKSGFYLISMDPAPKVKCWSCKVESDIEWMEWKGPNAIHIMMSPECKIAQQQDIEDEETASFPGPVMSRSQLQKIYKPRCGFEDDKEAAIMPSPSKDQDSFWSHTFDASKSIPSKVERNSSKSTLYSLPDLKALQSPTSSFTSQQSSYSMSLDDKLCVVCLDSRKQYAIVPCGHLCVCYDCAQQLEHCPICRIKKIGTLRIYDA